MKRDFLAMADVDGSQLEQLLIRSDFMKKKIVDGDKDMDLLKGKNVITLFYENSTRTRCSFESAAKYLGAYAVGITTSGSSVKKGESLIDTAVTLDKMMADVIIIRHSVAGAPRIIAAHTKASVINAGDGMHAHPTQALLDMYTMREKFGSLKGLEVAIIGDVKHSRVAQSNIVGLSKMGAKVKVFAPNTLMPKGIENQPCKVCKNVDEAFKGSDVIMGLRIQLERQQKGLFPSIEEYSRFYGVTAERMKLCNAGAIVMHPGPANRGIEIDCDVLDSQVCYKDEQVTNGVATRMALLEWVSSV
ncbi:MAG: aspartate carbamoyltransferase catalytic subunit [Clostridia bacterium]|nr:aspartate carbamoyltransferase catalytic subunit [Clostridia bacterium]MDE7328962.1 aspartate carbamoyltransferase catalytic subunit [Clostridia bacterium]